MYRNAINMVQIAVATCFAFASPSAIGIVLSPVESSTITDENGDGAPEIVGFGFGHPDDPRNKRTLVQKAGGEYPYERRSVAEFSLAGLSTVEFAAFTLYFHNTLDKPSTFEAFLAAGDGEIHLSDFALASPSLGSR